jgi:LemA protein
MEAVYIILLVLVIILFAGITLYNRLVSKKNLMQEAWSGIDVYLKKRYDLIPNLVETVKGYAAHEKGLLEQVTRLRTAAMQAPGAPAQIQSEKELTRALGHLFAVAENYPELKASQNFRQLQEDLRSLESEIEMSRRYYNGTVRENNILIEKFPGNIIAGLFGFTRGVFFEMDNPAERELPKVAF